MTPPAPIQNPASSSSTSLTTTQTDSIPIHPPRLILRAEPAEERHIQWADDVVDNEGMGKKSSKVCCIYHRPHAVDGSSDSDDSSSSSSSDESDRGDNDDRARPIGGGSGGARRSRARRNHRPRHEHDHDHDRDHGGKDEGDSSGHGHGKGKGKAKRKPSPNAYEKMPKYTPAGKEQSEER